MYRPLLFSTIHYLPEYLESDQGQSKEALRRHVLMSVASTSVAAHRSATVREPSVCERSRKIPMSNPILMAAVCRCCELCYFYAICNKAGTNLSYEVSITVDGITRPFHGIRDLHQASGQPVTVSLVDCFRKASQLFENGREVCDAGGSHRPYLEAFLWQSCRRGS